MIETDVAGLLAGSDDPVVHHHLDLGRVTRAWLGDVVDGAAAVVVEHEVVLPHAPPGARAVTAVGPARSLDPLLVAVAGLLPAPWRVVVDDHATLPAAWTPAQPSAWYWMTTTEVPAVVAGAVPVGDVVEVTDPAEVEVLLDEANAGSFARPGLPGIECWVGVRRAGRLVSTGALVRQATDGTGFLRGITTLPSWAGRGLGSAVTADLVRRAVAGGPGIAALGVWTDNEPAVRLYRRLGFRTGHTFVSGLVDPAG